MINKTLRYNYYVYIITNSYCSTLYIGVTNNLERRIYEHKNKLFDGFSKQYNLNKLVYYEYYPDINYAIQREKQLKNWHHDWKINLVRQNNPNFQDLAKDWGC
ncbi:MAG TPA: GIY-YIG nuclease family protein [bacterium]|nr:GIY-YIG nuclease family protein [bacterium]